MNVEEKVYCKEVFTLGPSFETDISVSLTNNSITYESKSAKTNEVIDLDDVIGAKVVSSLAVGDANHEIDSAFIHIFSYPLRKKWFYSKVARCRVEYVFCVSDKGSADENLKVAKKWVRRIKWLLVKNSDVNLGTPYEELEYQPKQHFLIFINPFGGNGTAKRLFEKNVKPMLEEADVEYELKTTNYMGHAREIIKDMHELKTFDCIVCCSGDGIVNEVINGLMSRLDWHEAIKIPIAHIPCGSGNGLAAAVLYHSGEPFDMISSVFSIVTGENIPLDIMKAQTANSEAHYSFLAIVFGIVADVDIESESFRKIGDFRFTVFAFKKILERQTFNAKLWYLPADDNVNESNSCSTESKSHPLHGDENGDIPNEEHRNLEDRKLESGNNLKDGKLANGILGSGVSEKTKTGPSHGVEITDVALEGNDFKDEKLGNGSLGDGILGKGNLNNGCLSNGNPGCPNRNLPDFQKPIPDSWKSIEGDFIGLLFMSTSHIGKDAFSAPEAVFGDGIIHCMCISGEITRKNMLDVLLKLGSGEHVNVEGVTMLKARAFRIEPYSVPSKIITIDGERVEFGKTQAEIYRGLARARCRRPAETTTN